MGIDDLLSEADVAKVLGIAVSTLVKNRSLGKGHPPFIRVGRKVFYPRRDLERWLDDRRLIREVRAV